MRRARRLGFEPSCLAAAYRASQHESTGMTPNLLMLGREARLPAELVFGSSTQDRQQVSSYGEYGRAPERPYTESTCCSQKTLTSSGNTQQGIVRHKNVGVQ